MSDTYWQEISLPLWALAHQNEDSHCCETFYSNFKEEVAYCAACGRSLEFVENKGSYE